MAGLGSGGGMKSSKILHNVWSAASTKSGNVNVYLNSAISGNHEINQSEMGV